MIYIISKVRYQYQSKRIYKIFDTISESVLKVSTEELKNIILNSNIKVVNATIQNNNIILKEWPNAVHSEMLGIKTIELGASYILLAKMGPNYKIVKESGDVYNATEAELKEVILANNVANCQLAAMGTNTNFVGTDYYTIQKDTEFEKTIRAKYNSFISKSLAVGRGDNSFEYEIENQEVRLKKYKGSSKTVILPPFITSIKRFAFAGSGVKEITLNRGLKVIGAEAFHPGPLNDGIERIEIPDTVELIGNNAFIQNRKMIGSCGSVNMAKIKLLGDKTIILEQRM